MTFSPSRVANVDKEMKTMLRCVRVRLTLFYGLN